MATFNVDGLKKVYTGKTKDVYQFSETKILLSTKDETTGWWKTDDKGVEFFEEDPGGNQVGPAVSGMGLKNLYASDYYFRKFKLAGIPNHFVESDLCRNLMLVDSGEIFGNGLEAIVRYYAMGSLIRRYPQTYKEGAPTPGFFETTLKSDVDNDPIITKEELIEQGIMNADLYLQMRKICRAASELIREDLAKDGLTLVDIKFELALVNGKMSLIDEVSAGVMRVARGSVTAENILSETELADILLAKSKQSRLVDALILGNVGDCCCV